MTSILVRLVLSWESGGSKASVRWTTRMNNATLLVSYYTWASDAFNKQETLPAYYSNNVANSEVLHVKLMYLKCSRK